jgi:hypothetical protein
MRNGRWGDHVEHAILAIMGSAYEWQITFFKEQAERWQIQCRPELSVGEPKLQLQKQKPTFSISTHTLSEGDVSR